MALSLPGTESLATDTGAVMMDEAAFRRLYHHTSRPLRAYLTRCCGDPVLADDLQQEAYLRLLRSGFEGEDDDHRKNYLFRIATNLMRDHFRRKRPETHEVPETDDTPIHDEVFHRQSDVGGAMAELSLRDRQMLWLAYVEGASHQEIANVLGLRTASIRSMLFRARRRMADQLQARGLKPSGETP